MNVITNNDAKCTTALAGLKFVDDPEVGLNVVDLGLIYELDFQEDEKKIVCTMTLTSEFCPMGETITSDVTRALQNDFPEYSIEINLIFQPPWGYENISEEGHEFLGY